MEPKQKNDKPTFLLPRSVATVADISKMVYEVEKLDNYLRELAVRETGKPMELPNMSKDLEELADINNLNLLHEKHRDYLAKSLMWIRENAPQVHISFSAEPSPQFTQKITVWFRENVSPILLLRVGLQPTIGVGCMLRTTNKIFDFSLKQRFASQKELLINELAAESKPNPAEQRSKTLLGTQS